MTIIGFTDNPNAILIRLTKKSAIGKRIFLPRASPYFKILNNKEFDFGWEDNILVVCDPTISNDEKFEIVFPSMLPHATKGEFFLLFSIIKKQNDVIIAGTLSFKDYVNAHKHFKVRRNNKYLPIIWEG